MRKFAGCVETEGYTSYLWGEVSNARMVSNLLQTHDDDLVAAMLVDHDALEKKKFTFNVPTHGVRLLAPIDMLDSGELRVQVYT